MALFSAPVTSGKLGYGYNGIHLAQDYTVPENTPVYAAGAGTIEFVGDDGPLGNTIKITHPGGYQTFYGNLTTFLGTVGDTVGQGQEIGTSGGGVEEPNPGDSNGPHLPYQVWFNGKAINPVSVTAPPNATQTTTASDASFNSATQTTTASAASWNPLVLIELLSRNATTFSALVRKVENPGFWLRGAFIVTGCVLLLIVLVQVFAHSNTGSAAISTGTSAAKTAITTAVLAPK
jgi:pyruvate/2-oxoglutarate dehydrogenase complex dihydrolipoamide acyltransferase (E2) component